MSFGALAIKSRRRPDTGPNNPGYSVLDQWLHIQKAAAGLPQSTTQHLFTVTGLIRVRLLVARVTTIIQSTDPVAKVTSTPTVGTAVDVASTVDLSSLEVGGFVLVEGDGTALVKSNAGAAFLAAGVGDWICPAGTIDLITGASKTGALKWELYYQPMDATGDARVYGSR